MQQLYEKQTTQIKMERSIFMSLASRLKQAREQKGLSQEDLARLSGVSQQTIQKIETGKAKKTAYILELASALSIDPYWLKDGKKANKIKEEAPSYLTIEPSYKEIPMLQGIDVIRWVKENILPENYRRTEMVGLVAKVSERAFCMEVKGSSMVSIYNASESYYPGEIIVVDPERKVSPGSIVIASLKGGEPMIRLYEQDGENYYLKAFDSINYPNIKIDSSVDILGVVMQKTKLVEAANS